MNITKEDFDFMVSYRVEELVNLLIEDKGLSILEAFDKVYNSRTFKLLTDHETGLYFQSPLYIYSYLLEELV